MCHDRRGPTKLQYMDRDWQRAPFSIGNTPAPDVLSARPSDFEAMRAIAETFAADFPFIQVDLYSHQGSIYVGELTWYPFAGYTPVKPESADLDIGQWLDLSSVNCRPKRPSLDAPIGRSA